MTAELDMEQVLFTLILHAGNARSKAKEAVEFANEGDWEQAEACLRESTEEQTQAHAIAADLIRQEAAGKPMPFSVLLVHALDLLLLGWSEQDFTEQHIQLMRRVQALEGEASLWREQNSKK